MKEKAKKQTAKVDKSTEKLNKKGSTATISKQEGASSKDMLGSAKEMLGGLYHNVEKPIGNVMHSVENNIPASLKGYSSFIMALLPVLSVSMLILGLFNLFKLRIRQ